MSEINLGQVVGPRGFQGIQGVKGDKGDQGIQGVVGPKVDVAASLGTSTVYAVSQKLLTDEVGKMTTSIATIKSQSDASIVKVDNAVTEIDTKTTELMSSILGINKKLTNRIKALEESNISSLFNNGANNGIWLDPSDLKTMFQTVGGTVPVTKDGDPVGLILDKSKSLELSLELADDTKFSSASNYNISGSGISLNGGKLSLRNATSSNYARVKPMVAGSGKVKIGAVYEVRLVISNYISGTIAISCNGTAAMSDGKNGEHVFIVTAGSGSGYMSVNGYGGNASYDVESVSIKQIFGNHASQPLAASRPTYRTDGALHWLQFDGVDDYLQVQPIGTLNIDMGAVVAYKLNAVKIAQVLLSSGISGATDVMLGTINSNFIGSSGSSLTLEGELATTDNSTASLLWNTNNARYLKTNKGNYATASKENIANFSTNYPINVGANAVLNRLLAGRIYGVILLSKTTKQDVDFINEVAYNKIGVTI